MVDRPAARQTDYIAIPTAVLLRLKTNKGTIENILQGVTLSQHVTEETRQGQLQLLQKLIYLYTFWLFVLCYVVLLYFASVSLV